MKKTHAFTLMEVMLVAIILSSIAVFALPNYFYAVENIHAKNAQKILMEIYGSQKRYHIRHEAYAANLSSLDVEPRINPSSFETPAITTATATTFEASIRRNSSNPYTLSIDHDARVTCVPVNPADHICSKLKF